MNLKLLSDSELVVKLKDSVAEERRLTAEVLYFLSEVDSRMLFAEMGFSSLYEFCVKHLGYSDGSAYRRIQSMRLLRSLPANEQMKIESKIKTGELSISNLSLLQGFLKTKKKEGKLYTDSERLQFLSTIEKKSKREVVRELAILQPLIVKKESERTISADLTEVKFTINQQLQRKITRVKKS